MRLYKSTVQSWGLSNPADNVSYTKKDEKNGIPHPALFHAPEPRTPTQCGDEAESGNEMTGLEERKAFLMGKRFNVVPLCNIKPHSVSIDSGVLYSIMKKISPEFDVSDKELTGENRELHWTNTFDFIRV